MYKINTIGTGNLIGQYTKYYNTRHNKYLDKAVKDNVFNQEAL